MDRPKLIGFYWNYPLDPLTGTAQCVSRYRWVARILFLLFAPFLLSACVAIVRPNFQTEAENLRPGNYELDTRHSSVIFKVSHLGLSTYVGRFNSFDATMYFSPDDIAATRLDGFVEVDSVDTGDAEVDTLLSEAAWFDAASYPRATFKTVSVTETGGDDLAIQGELTMRGVTRPITLSGKFNGGADNLLTRRYTIGFSATGSFSRSAFGMESFAGLVGDEVQIEVFAEFLQNPG